MITHLSANQTGGAAISARRLHNGLQSLGTDSHFLSLVGEPNTKLGVDVLPKLYPRFWHNAAYRLGFPVQQHLKWQRRMKQLDCEGLFTSNIESDHDVLSHPTVQEASVLNLHWVPGMLDWKTFFASVDRPLVWTLHDMNPFLGIFHYTVDRDRASPALQRLDRDILEIKKRILHSLDRPPVIVSPSKWLLRESSQSELFSGLRHVHIPYGLDTTVFKPFPQGFARDVFQLPQDRKLMLVVAEQLDDHRKGFDLLVDALSSMKLPYDLELVAVGKGAVPVASMRCHHLGSIHDERLMALLYSAVDYTAITSRQDNLPNVVLESLCCGTPVVGTPAGGIPEPIISERDGFVAESISSSALSDAIRQAISQTFDRERIAKEAAARYNGVLQARRCQALYDEMCHQA